jgi:hypothetical protein
MLGIFLINPAFDAWKKYFLELMSPKDKGADANQ